MKILRLDQKLETQGFLSHEKKPRVSSFREYKRIVLCFLVGTIVTTGGAYFLNHLKSNRTFGPVVHLDVGKVQGTIFTLHNLSIDAFLGVPFAAPPIGSKRFEKTSPLNSWTGVKLAIAEAPNCIQLDEPEIEGTYSEDCLYFNIFRPHRLADDPLPILFNIHGGAFELGGAGTFGIGTTRALRLLERGAIVVSIQYRLGVYGFASDGTDKFPGNLGFWDQKEALEFISRNAEKLGGDPKRITIIGCSAGSASVTALSISPHTRDLVHQAIAMSGSTFAAWAYNDVVVDNTNQLTSVLRRGPDESAKDVLKRASSIEIYRAVMKIGTTHFSQNFGTFIPRFDADFFPVDLPQLISEAPPKVMVIGMTSEESLPWSAACTCSALVLPLQKRANFSVNDVEGLVRGHIVTEKEFKDKTKEVQDKILRFYLKSAQEQKNRVFYLQRYTQLFSDLQFNVPVLWEILRRKAHGWKIYAYRSSYINNILIPSTCPVTASYHGSDQHYANVIDFDYFDSRTDIRMENIYADWLVSFVVRGNPSTPEIKWLPTSNEFPLRFAEFLPQPRMKEDLFGDRAEFWSNLTRDYDYDLVRMTNRKVEV